VTLIVRWRYYWGSHKTWGRWILFSVTAKDQHVYTSK